MKALRIGIAATDDFKARTSAIAKGRVKARPREPKIWFNSAQSPRQADRRELGAAAGDQAASAAEHDGVRRAHRTELAQSVADVEVAATPWTGVDRGRRGP